MKWGIISPSSTHFQSKMKFAFEGHDCVYASRSEQTVEVMGTEVRTLSLNDMLPLVDAVYICTPTLSHYHIAKRCLGNHKHVLCEKPLAKTSSEVLELQEIAQRSDLKLGMTFQPFFKMWEEMASARGSLAPIIGGVATYTMPLKGELDDVVFDVGVYPAMTARYLAQCEINLENTKFSVVDKELVADLTFANGQKWLLRCSDDYEFSQHVELYGNQGSESFDKPWTDDAESRIYWKVLDDFENGKQFAGAVSLYREVCDFLTKWKEECHGHV